MWSVLLVEDHEPMRWMLRLLLSDLAAPIHECGDGAEAGRAYAAARPDWVLMDIALPGLDGIAATQQLIAAYPDARVVIVTDYNDAEMRQAAEAAGARGYVLKENLLDLRRLLQSQD
jgi:DNA-binding NarL/FixJ family response regulator